MKYTFKETLKYNQLTEQIYELSYEVNDLRISEKKEKELYKEIDSLKLQQQKIKLDDYKKHVKKQFNYYNCIVCELYSKTKTVNLLTEFIRGDKSFLILKNQIFMPRHYKYCSLIVDIKTLDIFSNYEIKPTMSDLKATVKNTPDVKLKKDTTERLKPLFSELTKLDDNIPVQTQNQKVYLFKHPFLIGGQTTFNRIGYGNVPYSLGALYGETSDFMIIGIIL